MAISKEKEKKRARDSCALTKRAAKAAAAGFRTRQEARAAARHVACALAAAEETKAIRVEVYATAASCGERISWELSGDLKSFVAEARLEAHVAAQLWRWRGAGVRG